MPSVMILRNSPVHCLQPVTVAEVPRSCTFRSQLVQNCANQLRVKNSVITSSIRVTRRASQRPRAARLHPSEYIGIHHVGVLCKTIEVSLEFYCNVLGMEINPNRPNDKLPYKGVWLWVGKEMIHLMELPNPDPYEGRPEHGGRDRHVCLSINDIKSLELQLKENKIPYTKSRSGRSAIFFRDPDSNVLEVVEL